MILSGRCPKCGSTKIAGPHRVHGGNGWVKIDLPGVTTATLEAFTCAECGYSELYADRIGLNNIRSSGRFLTADPRMYSTGRTLRCSNCGTELAEGSTFCRECGYPVG